MNTVVFYVQDYLEGKFLLTGLVQMVELLNFKINNDNVIFGKNEEIRKQTGIAVTYSIVGNYS